MTGSFIQDRQRSVTFQQTPHPYRKLRYVNLLSWDCVIRMARRRRQIRGNVRIRRERTYSQVRATWRVRIRRCVTADQPVSAHWEDVRVCVCVGVFVRVQHCVMVDRTVLDAALYASGSGCTPLRSWDLCSLKLMCSCLLAQRNNYSCLWLCSFQPEIPKWCFPLTAAETQKCPLFLPKYILLTLRRQGRTTLRATACLWWSGFVIYYVIGVMFPLYSSKLSIGPVLLLSWRYK